ncbi:(2,3-dihydroxybenzoyl)adenylate synthase [Pseudoalteromonas sp. McH1-7]|uniref:(2,3-dihydroxybenzoyl)adenylate synthase n=1 Tax=Pseudoalteromonas sp. McH1-7 TaxID=2745574 RepID=UPI001590AC26|nr:(2,3-dihydroxybenzoyl)adenylate synthase [Pseudoalteromonas sp. McH1-7]NUZ11426.1 (2,3-dihydroxybenzoyl)adenylate synthase [Pseudoalteromonas sp. McH1-7]
MKQIDFTPWPPELAKRYREKGYWQDRPLTSVISDQLAQHGDKPAVIDAHRSLTYQELEAYSDHLAAYLAAQGIQQGDTALIQLANQVEFYISLFALLKLGAAPVCALFSHKQTEINSYCEQLEPTVLIVSSAHELYRDDAFIQTLQQQYPSIRTTLVDHPKGNSLLKQAYLQPRAFIAPDLNPEHVAFFQLSGGSTGTPKLIPRTHNDYLYSVVASKDICELTEQHVYLCALPAPHNFPLSSPGALGVFAAGGTVVMANDPSPSSCFQLIERYQVTHTALVPPALQLWLQHAPKSAHNLQSLVVIQVGGAKLSLTIAEQVKPLLGCQLQQVFGMAEGLVNYTRYDDDLWHILHTQGRPISEDDEIKVVDEQGNLVPDGEEGRLLTRGPYTIRGYYRSPEHNQSAFDEHGFYSSGDLVKRLPSGHLIVTGRVKDQINRGGEKIAAEEVENLLLGHPNIQQAAIVAMPDATLGEKSFAFLTGIPVKALALRKYLREQGIADYKVPDKFKFIDNLPLTPVGKVDKKQLRNETEVQQPTPQF